MIIRSPCTAVLSTRCRLLLRGWITHPLSLAALGHGWSVVRYHVTASPSSYLRPGLSGINGRRVLICCSRVSVGCIMRVVIGLDCWLDVLVGWTMVVRYRRPIGTLNRSCLCLWPMSSSISTTTLWVGLCRTLIVDLCTLSSVLAVGTIHWTRGYCTKRFAR